MRDLREKGYYCPDDCIVERFIKFVGRKDLFGIIDLIALKPGEILGVQSCSTGYSAHYRTITIEKMAASIKWLQAGGQLELWSWRKLKKVRGGKATYWSARIKRFNLTDFGINGLSQYDKICE
jgi:hypothetical protein